jgi:serine/threonine protein phosphatase PrpC
MTQSNSRRTLHKGKSSTVHYCIGFDFGVQRDTQQDAFAYVSPNSTNGQGEVFIVADGMGGMAAGEKASYLVTEAFRERYGEFRAAGRDAMSAMEEVIHYANSRVLAEAAIPGQQGMGSTVVALAIDEDCAWVAHVGDSRAYRLDDHGFHRITKDHSRVQRLVDSGILTEEQAEQHPDAHVLSQAVGRPEIEVDLNGAKSYPVHDQLYLLCSDGLTGMLPDRVIELALRSLPPYEAAASLMDLANDLDSTDNIALAIVSARAPQPAYRAAYDAEATALRTKAGVSAAPTVPLAERRTPAPLDSVSEGSRRATARHRHLGATALVSVVAALVLVWLAIPKESYPNRAADPSPPEHQRDSPRPPTSNGPTPSTTPPPGSATNGSPANGTTSNSTRGSIGTAPPIPDPAEQSGNTSIDGGPAAATTPDAGNGAAGPDPNPQTSPAPDADVHDSVSPTAPSGAAPSTPSDGSAASPATDDAPEGSGNPGPADATDLSITGSDTGSPMIQIVVGTTDAEETEMTLPMLVDDPQLNGDDDSTGGLAVEAEVRSQTDATAESESGEGRRGGSSVRRRNRSEEPDASEGASEGEASTEGEGE